MKWILTFLLLIPSFSFAQNLATDEKLVNLGNFAECGLVTRFASSKIPSNCLTVAKNVYFDEDLSMSRRYGYTLYNSTPCANLSRIKGLWNYNSVDGQRYMVVFSSNSFYWTKDQRDCNKIDIISKRNEFAEYECVQALGELNCTNGVDLPFATDIASTHTIGTQHYPLSQQFYPKHIGTFRSRIVIAGINGEPSRIRMSGYGDSNDWDIYIPGVSTNSTSIDISGLEDGKDVNCLLGQFQNGYYIGRIDDLWQLGGNDRRDFTLRQVSNQIGVKDCKSVREKDNSLVWLSGRGIEKLSGTTINRASDGIKPEIDMLIKSAGNTRTKNYSDTEWTTGLYSNDRTSTDIIPGVVSPSTWSYIDTENYDFNLGTFTNTVSSFGYVSLGYSGVVRAFDDYILPNLSPNPVWTCTGDCASTLYAHNRIGLQTQSGAKTIHFTAPSITQMNGQWKMTGSVGQTGSVDYYFISTTDNYSTTNGYMFRYASSNYAFSISIYRLDAGTKVLLNSVGVGLISETYTINRNLNGVIDIKNSINQIVLSSTDTTYSPTDSTSYIGTDVISTLPNSADLMLIANIYVPSNHYLSGQFNSRIFDTTFDSPIGGPFYFYEITPIGSSVTYKVRDSAINSVAGMGPWIDVTPNISGEFRSPLTKRYQQYMALLTTQYSTQTPQIGFAGLSATSTGYYIADCVDVQGVTSWGNFRPLPSLTGASRISYYISTGTTCHEVTRSTANWTLQDANALIVTGFPKYLGIRAFLEPYTTTDTLRLNSLTVEWNEGSSRPPVATVVYNDRYYLFYTTNTAQGATNNMGLVLDMYDKWSTLAGINAYSATAYNNYLFTGDSNQTGKLYMHCDYGNLRSCYGDDGADYDFSIKTSDFDYGNPLDKKELKRIYLTLKTQETSGQNIKLNVKYYINGSTVGYSLGEAELTESVEPGYFIAKFPAINTLPVTFNWLSIGVDYISDEHNMTDSLKIYSISTVYKTIRME